MKDGMKNAMKDALMKRRGRGIDISIMIEPQENEEMEETVEDKIEKENMAKYPKDGLSPGPKEKEPEKVVEKEAMAEKGEPSEGKVDMFSNIISDGENKDAGRMMRTGAGPKSLRERMIMAAKEKLGK